MPNAHANIETANVDDHHGNYSHVAPMRLRFVIGAKVNRYALRVLPHLLRALEDITKPVQSVTKCDHPRVCHMDMPK